jgi:hypothetical protein
MQLFSCSKGIAMKNVIFADCEDNEIVGEFRQNIIYKNEYFDMELEV